MTGHLISLLLIFLGAKSTEPNARTYFTVAGNVLAVATTIIGITVGTVALISMYNDLENNIAQLIGFGISCFLIGIMYTIAGGYFRNIGKTSVQEKAKTIYSARYALTHLTVFPKVLSLCTLFLTFILGQSAAALVTSFISSFYDLVASSFGLLAMSVLLGGMYGSLELWSLTGGNQIDLK